MISGGPKFQMGEFEKEQLAIFFIGSQNEWKPWLLREGSDLGVF